MEENTNMLCSKIIMIISIFFFCSLIILFLRIKIKLIDFIFVNNKVRYKIVVYIYLFGIIKIFKILMNEECIKIGFIKHKYDFNKMKDIKLNKNNLWIYLNVVKKINIEKFDILIEIGSKNIFLNVYVIPLLSTFFCYIFSKKIDLINFNKLNYKIIPKYNENLLNIKFNFDASINLIKLIFYLIKRE